MSIKSDNKYYDSLAGQCVVTKKNMKEFYPRDIELCKRNIRLSDITLHSVSTLMHVRAEMNRQ